MFRNGHSDRYIDTCHLQESYSAPVVYYRNHTGNPLPSFQTLGGHWIHSKAIVSLILKKFEEKNLITLISFKGKHGSIIYLNYYLSVIFDISDVMIDKVGSNMPAKKNQGYHIPEDDSRFHVTYKFLRQYSDATYSLKEVVRQMESQFRLKYGTSVDDFLDSIYVAGAELTCSDIAERAKSIDRNNKMLELLDSSADLLRNNHKHGEQYY